MTLRFSSSNQNENEFEGGAVEAPGEDSGGDAGVLRHDRLESLNLSGARCLDQRIHAEGTHTNCTHVSTTPCIGDTPPSPRAHRGSMRIRIPPPKPSGEVTYAQPITEWRGRG